jgi:hypothetical protein
MVVCPYGLMLVLHRSTRRFCGRIGCRRRISPKMRSSISKTCATMGCEVEFSEKLLLLSKLLRLGFNQTNNYQVQLKLLKIDSVLSKTARSAGYFLIRLLHTLSLILCIRSLSWANA